MVKTVKAGVPAVGEIRKAVLPVLRKNGVAKAGFFGSFVRGEASAKSDVDILVEFRGRKSLFDLSHLEIELEDTLGRKVDVVTYNSLHPLLKDRILREEVKIL
ncbi:MAG: nucleotidyltransferase family protein [Candidatus Altiarchaeota archaeon]|nr:nucleotidyltransferase family protein [Candidatus Altiarchaeota archaeon]